jgi:hypothetical protein
MKYGMFVFVYNEWQFCGIIDKEYVEDFINMQKNLDHVRAVTATRLQVPGEDDSLDEVDERIAALGKVSN